MLENLNHVVPFILAITLAVTALQHLLAFLFRSIGLQGAASFFNPAV